MHNGSGRTCEAQCVQCISHAPAHCAGPGASTHTSCLELVKPQSSFPMMPYRAVSAAVLRQALCLAAASVLSSWGWPQLGLGVPIQISSCPSDLTVCAAVADAVYSAAVLEDVAVLAAAVQAARNAERALDEASGAQLRCHVLVLCAWIGGVPVDAKLQSRCLKV